MQVAERPAAGMISPQQHNKLMKEYEKRGRIGLSAAKAGVDHKTGRKYIGGAPGPLEPRPPRGWRTHEDAFGGVWPETERRLDREPGLSAKTLWEELLREHGEKFRAGQRRSFERRVRGWKDRYGSEPELFFTQEHRAGERLQIDWVDCRELGVRIGGEAFCHKLVHVVLPFSNWEWARVCYSESFLSLKIGLQSATWKLGGVPLICQSDNSSTATHALGRGRPGREYNPRYLSLLAYYGMRPGLIAVGEAHQNGDVESAHNHLVAAIDQGLMLGGSREFGTVEDYENFVAEVMRRRNEGRGERLEQERLVLQRLPAARLPEYEEEEVRVSREAIARVGKQGYSVPARWAGRRLRARIKETKIAFYNGADRILEVERHRGNQGVYVDWRHVLPQLLRKPGAFARWRHREQMFPSRMWRELYDALLSRQSGGRAEREYLGMLALALEHGLEKIEEKILRFGVAGAGLDAMRRELEAASKVVVVDFRADLSSYDALIAAAEQQEVCHG